MMNKIYKAHILFTKEQSRFEVLENGYVAVDTEGRVLGVATDLSTQSQQVVCTLTSCSGRGR